MDIRWSIRISFISLLFFHISPLDARLDPALQMPSDISGRRLEAGEGDSVGTRWAILIAGSSDIVNYRHQADVCHAYQVMKNGGLRDENIIVFMYDDIAYDPENPRQGIIINRPDGGDVYAGVPKDYVGDDVNVDNLCAVLLGNMKGVSGGSGKVVDSGPSSVKQHDADLLYFWHKFLNSPEGSSKKHDAHKEMVNIMTHRLHVDNSINLIGKLLFGLEEGMKVLNAIRPAELPLVDDWACLKSMVRTFETHCGPLSQYGMKHMRSLANICNAGIKKETMARVSTEVCNRIPSTAWSSLHRGFNA